MQNLIIDEEKEYLSPVTVYNAQISQKLEIE